MNKKEAVAYAQVTLNYMQSSKYTGEINSITLGIEMKQTFKLYRNSIICCIADAQMKALNELQIAKNNK